MTTPVRPGAILTFFALTFGWTWGLWAIALWIGDDTSGWSSALEKSGRKAGGPKRAADKNVVKPDETGSGTLL